MTEIQDDTQFVARMRRKLDFILLVEKTGLTREAVAHAIRATPGQLRGWLSGRRSVEDFFNNNSTPRSNLNSPPSSAIASLQACYSEILLISALRALKFGQRLDLEQPLNKQEFNELNPVQADSLTDDGKYLMLINGRSGKVGHLIVDLDDKSPAEMADKIQQAGWQSYVNMMSDQRMSLLVQKKPSTAIFPEFEHVEDFLRAKQHYLDLITIFQISHPMLSKIMNVSTSYVASWVAPGYPRFPPVAVVDVLQRALQEWAVGVAYIADKYTMKPKEMPDFERPDIPIEALKTASTSVVALTAFQIEQYGKLVQRGVIDKKDYTVLPHELSMRHYNGPVKAER